MSIDAYKLKTFIIEPTLGELALSSPSAVNLLLGTAAQESHMFKYVRQMGFNNLDGSGAFGGYQHELDTAEDDINNFLLYRKELAFKVHPDIFNMSRYELGCALIGDPFFATAMCRIHYLRAPETLPDADDIEGLAKYWKQYYNTEKGKGTEKDFISNYRRYVK